MSKYFTDESEISSLTEQLPTDNQSNFVVPTPQAVKQQEIPIQETPETITPPPKTVEEHIAHVNAQNNEITRAVKEISETTATEIKNTFESMEVLELFERMNQISFLLIKMNNRLTSIEEVMVGKQDVASLSDVPEVKLSPREQFIQQGSKDLTPVEEANKKLSDAQKGVTGLPSEDYIDKGANLEKMFPNMPEEAYQASYNTNIEESKSPKGGTTGVVF